MPFYEIMGLYRRFESYMQEENEAKQAEVQQYQDEIDAARGSTPDINQSASDLMSKYGTGSINMDSISKGFTGF